MVYVAVQRWNGAKREARGPGGTAAGLVERWKVAGESGTTDEIRVPARKRHSTLLGDRVLDRAKPRNTFYFDVRKLLQ